MYIHISIYIHIYIYIYIPSSKTLAVLSLVTPPGPEGLAGVPSIYPPGLGCKDDEIRVQR
jgi:hypothetical protein